MRYLLPITFLILSACTSGRPTDRIPIEVQRVGPPAEGLAATYRLQAARRALQANLQPTTAGWADLIRRADAALSRQPNPAAVFDVPGYYGRGRDEHVRQKTRLSDDMAAAYVCAVAAVINHNLPDTTRAAYAAKAREIVLSWAATNRQIAGDDGMLVGCYNGASLLTTALLLCRQPGWSDADTLVVDRWVVDVFAQQTAIKFRKNNWAAWGLFASAMMHSWLGDRDGLADDSRLLRGMIDSQIAADGGMPHEIRRGDNGIWYTYFALAPLTAAAEVLRTNGQPDLFHHVGDDGAGLKAALTFLHDRGYVGSEPWPVGGVEPRMSRQGADGALMYVASMVYGNAQWGQSALHPIWRGDTGLAWMVPSLLPVCLSPKN